MFIQLGNIVVGWLAGSDRIGEYKRELKHFDPSKWNEDHDYSPFLKDKYGYTKVEMIENPRITSGTIARETAKYLSFEQWLNNISPHNINEDSIRIYKDIYIKLRRRENFKRKY